MTNISEWSVTAGLNTSSPPDGWPEGMARSAVNDAAREMQAAIARFYKDQSGQLVSAGTAAAFTLTTNSVYTALNDIGLLTFRALNATTGATTLAVDGLTAKSIVTRDGLALFHGDIRINQMVTVVYNSNQDRFELYNDVGERAGSVKGWGGTTEPPGWLFAYGQSLVRTDYPHLFGAISTTYGAADGTHFTLPDLRGRVTAYRDDMGGASANRLIGSITNSLDGDALGAVGGLEGASIAKVNLDSFTMTVTGSAANHHHNHTIAISGSQSGGMTRNFSETILNAMDNSGAIDGVQALDWDESTLGISGSVTDVNTGTISVSGTAASGGSGASLSKVQPTIVLNGIIKT